MILVESFWTFPFCRVFAVLKNRLQNFYSAPRIWIFTEWAPKLRKPWMSLFSSSFFFHHFPRPSFFCSFTRRRVFFCSLLSARRRQNFKFFWTDSPEKSFHCKCTITNSRPEMIPPTACAYTCNNFFEKTFSNFFHNWMSTWFWCPSTLRLRGR